MDVGLQALASALTGMVLVPFLQWFKARTGLKGEAMRAVALLGSIGLSVLVLFLTGKASGADIGTVNFWLSLMGAGTNQVAYAVWKLVWEKVANMGGG